MKNNLTNIKFLIFATQHGGHTICLIEKLFALNVNNKNIFIVTEDCPSNNSLVEFLKLFQISYVFLEKNRDYFSFACEKLEKIDIILSVFNKIIIKNEWINKCSLGAINLHPGYLPDYKGFYSIPWAMVNNEKFCGWTYHYITSDIDCGNILLQNKIEISKDDNAFNLHFKLIYDAINHLDKVLELVFCNYKGIKQEKVGKYYKNLPNDGYLSADWDIEKIDCYIKALYFAPNYYALYKKNDVIYKVNSVKDFLLIR